MLNRLNCLVLDIETFPMLAYVWGRKDVNIALNQLKQDWTICAWSAKWLEEKTVVYKDVRNSPSTSDFLHPLWRLLDKADIVITQNGQSFDIRKINAQFMLLGWHPPSSYRHLDTYRIARRVADFTSNSLEYLTDKLCTRYKKMKHSQFSGMSLWTECLKGNKKAWEEMKRYNITDTLATEELYLKLRPWVPETMPKPFKGGNPTLHCSTCKAIGTMTKWGFYHTNHGVWQRYSCNACGAYQKGAKR